ncbi:MAG: sigma-54 dependent transcriptional regulator [Proteobacteria bacterium]|nr:sigma-54 dependent transcriptional regulator [Pseudomonadota bacterium]MBU1455845.1 sigma-54 dependent transcriptional regulator [Pseudomonadota bacterium]
MTEQGKKRILLVDDDVAHRTMLKVNLSGEHFHILEADDGDQVILFLERNSCDLILLDMKMARMDGLATLKALQETVYASIPVIVLTAFSSVDTAVKAMREGAYDYVAKPVDLEELRLVIEKALSFQEIKDENDRLKKRLERRFSFGNMIGSSSAMKELFATLELVAPSDATVLITGESGTGKELVASALHQQSRRCRFPFVKVNCAALNENLLESELFGHESGAFTGAVSQRKGRFEQADKGTLFLDEIGDMSLPTQAKILRVLQEGELDRLGGSETIAVDVRLLAATHRNLQQMIEEGTFRQDLFFRLSVVPVELPPLRERRKDIPDLLTLFLDRYAEKNRKDIKGFHPEVLRIFLSYDWPGNIRELENTVERAVILCPGEQITVRELPSQLLPAGSVDETPHATTPLTLRDMEREMIRATLAQHKGNRSKTAKILGVARQTLLNKLKEYDLL